MAKKKDAGWIIAVITGILMVIAAVFVVGLLLIKLLWAWTIPDLFPGAVKQGLVAGTISWLAAFKLALFIAVLSGIASLPLHGDE
ncbi:hypothetical protein ACFL3J_01325 [Candidatus Omnitrophota bacterium]